MWFFHPHAVIIFHYGECKNRHRLFTRECTMLHFTLQPLKFVVSSYNTPSGSVSMLTYIYFGTLLQIKLIKDSFTFWVIPLRQFSNNDGLHNSLKIVFITLVTVFERYNLCCGYINFHLQTLSYTWTWTILYHTVHCGIVRCCNMKMCHPNSFFVLTTLYTCHLIPRL